MWRFFYRQPLAGEKGVDPLGLDAQVLFFESSTECRDGQGGVFNLLHQNGDRLGRGGLSDRCDPLRPLALLLCAKAWLGSQIHIEALMLLALQSGMVPQRPEKRTGPKPQKAYASS